MRFVSENTVDQQVILKGIGLHSGKAVTIIIQPVSEPTGILFHRSDIDKSCACSTLNDVQACERSIKAHARSVVSTRLGTTIANATGFEVATIEHLMAAFAITGVGHAKVDVFGPEIPILDGSAEPFTEAILEAGVKPLGLESKPLRVSRPIEVRDGERFIRVEPSDSLDLDVEIGFEDPAIGRQSVFLSMTSETARARMTLARTFCELKSVESLRALGLGQGGSVDNAIVVDQGRLLNKEGLRDPQEFVLHKALDLLGDLALLGKPLLARVTAYKPGHDLNNQLCLALLDDFEAQQSKSAQKAKRRWDPAQEATNHIASA